MKQQRKLYGIHEHAQLFILQHIELAIVHGDERPAVELLLEGIQKFEDMTGFRHELRVRKDPSISVIGAARANLPAPGRRRKSPPVSVRSSSAPASLRTDQPPARTASLEGSLPA